jgi:hypothetical protein
MVRASSTDSLRCYADPSIERPLLDYIITRNNWTQVHANMINWDAHERSIKSQNKRRIHVTKLVHDILPDK